MINAAQINKIHEYMNHYCPTWTKTNNPVVSAVIKDSSCIYYIFSYDAYYKTADAIVYDNDYDRCTREKELYIESLYEYDPVIIEDDEMIGARLTELYTSLGDISTLGDYNHIRNIENIHQLHMALKLNVSYQQNSDSPVCQVHIRTLSWIHEYFIYGYRHDTFTIECLEYDHSKGTIEYRTIKLPHLYQRQRWYEIDSRSQYLGVEINQLKEDIENEL